MSAHRSGPTVELLYEVFTESEDRACCPQAEAGILFPAAATSRSWDGNQASRHVSIPLLSYRCTNTGLSGVRTNSKKLRANRRAEVIRWLGALFPEFSLPLDSSDEELRELLSDGTVLCHVVNTLIPGVLEGSWGGYASSDERSGNVKKFLSVVADMGLPGFSVKDLDEGSMSSVVECLLVLRDSVDPRLGDGTQLDITKSPSRKQWGVPETERPQLPAATQGRRSPGEDRRNGVPDPKGQHKTSVFSDSYDPTGQKFREVFQLRRGSYSDLPAAKISEMMHSSSLDEEKLKIEERRKLGEDDVNRLTKEKEHSENIIESLKKEIEIMNKTYKQQIEQIETKAKQMEEQLTTKVKEMEHLLLQSNKKIEEVEAASELKSQLWNKRENIFQSYMDNQILHVKEIRISSQSIRNDMYALQMKWKDEMSNFGCGIKCLVDAAENYHEVLAENQKLFNEVQELKGNIRVYCRVRPFLPGQDKKSTTVDYIGENDTLGIWSTSQPNGLVVPDASLHQVKSTSDVLDLMEIGQANRAVGSTALNERSSRSHSILTVHVRGLDLKNGSTSRGCLHLIDLAGSERVERSEAVGDRLKEAQYINKSLSALGDVIFALAQKTSHVPYRNSKLTQVLQSSLGGQAKTLMFVQINPDVDSYSETMSTLKFAERVSGVELGAARSNKEGKDMKELLEQVASLKDTISRKDIEIEQLQLVKAPKLSFDRNGMTKNTVNQPSQLLSDERILKASDRVLSDPQSYVEMNGNSDHNSPTHIAHVGLGEPEYEDNASDDGLSAGETENSTSDRTTEMTTERIHRGPSRITRFTLTKNGQPAANRSKQKDAVLKTPSQTKAAQSNLIGGSSARGSKRWQ
ncbi:hypothetical protein PR202_gb01859 [Eleusine coracana subsp. coracana]|uniref:Kinesin-like protein n=1 Tax=Eleusine coracana subsp. coracana TaxID=191504 RepID=A0AAV5DXQ9_ELECO|nr:hypothetical protein PR202_gb01859 [Eleusine coracana subsp. coracana]